MFSDHLTLRITRSPLSVICTDNNYSSLHTTQRVSDELSSTTKNVVAVASFGAGLWTKLPYVLPGKYCDWWPSSDANTISILGVNQPARSSHHCIFPGLINRVPALLEEGPNINSSEWQVTLCDPIWHVSSRSGGSTANCHTPFALLYFT